MAGAPSPFWPARERLGPREGAGDGGRGGKPPRDGAGDDGATGDDVDDVEMLLEQMLCHTPLQLFDLHPSNARVCHAVWQAVCVDYARSNPCAHSDRELATALEECYAKARILLLAAHLFP